MGSKAGGHSIMTEPEHPARQEQLTSSPSNELQDMTQDTSDWRLQSSLYGASSPKHHRQSTGVSSSVTEGAGTWDSQWTMFNRAEIPFNESVQQLFQEIDTDNDGQLDQQELLHLVNTLCHRMGNEWLTPYSDRISSEVRTAVARFDTDNDGQLDLDELMTMLRSRTMMAILSGQTDDQPNEANRTSARVLVSADDGYKMEDSCRNGSSGGLPYKRELLTYSAPVNHAYTSQF